MSFVPVTGRAVFRAADRPRDGVVEFTDERRTVALPVRAALPVLARAHAREDLHPSVSLLSGAALLGMRLVAAGRFEPGEHRGGPGWRLGRLPDDDQDRVRRLAEARAWGELDAAGAEGVVRGFLDAVVDAMPRGAPPAAEPRGRRHPPRAGDRDEGGYADRLRARLERRARDGAPSAPDADLPHLVALSLRVEADEGELLAGAVRLVLQVHDEQNPAHVVDAALLWTREPGEAASGAGHGFGSRARTHAAIALRGAAEAWPVLERLLALRVPDEMTLDGPEIADLLEHGVEALRRRGVDVLWPRSLGRHLTTRAVLDATDPRHPRDRRPDGAADRPAGREEPLQTGLLGPDAMFAFRWQVALHGEPLSEEEMEELAAATSPMLRLRDQWVVVDPAVARRARTRLLRTVRPAQALAATLSGVVEVASDEGPVEEQVVVGATLERVRLQVREAATREPISPPAGLEGRLRDYQRHGLTWLADLTALGLGACLADDMGLGKTVTLIALHLHRHERPGLRGVAGPTLVVCPTSLLGTWEAELARFAPGVPVRRHHGSRRDLADLRRGATLPGTGPGPDPGFVLTTYGTMRRDAAALGEVPWDIVVADEAQHVKNPRSGTARALRTIRSESRVALTGTPVENDLTELWAILDWATPGLLGSRLAFRRRWAAPIEAGVDPAVTARFADLVQPFLLRRRKSDPGIAPELPDKTETDHLLGLTREQVVLYEALVRDAMARIERADEDSRRGQVLALLTGLKQICNHPAQFLRQSDPGRAGRSEKLDLLDELVGTVLAEEGAVLVFTQYVALARLLAAHLERSGVPHQLLHGGTPVAEREAMVARFQAGEVPVFLLSLRAGGTGLTLTRADHVVHVDRWWNPAVEDQATDRAHRIGQTRPVQVHRMVTRGTVEEQVAALLTRKRALADAVLGRGDAALTELTDAELRDLVTLRRSG